MSSDRHLKGDGHFLHPPSFLKHVIAHPLGDFERLIHKVKVFFPASKHFQYNPRINPVVRSHSQVFPATTVFLIFRNCNKSCCDRIEVDVSCQMSQIRCLVDVFHFVFGFKQMPCPFVSLVYRLRISVARISNKLRYRRGTSCLTRR